MWCSSSLGFVWQNIVSHFSPFNFHLPLTHCTIRGDYSTSQEMPENFDFPLCNSYWWHILYFTRMFSRCLWAIDISFFCSDIADFPASNLMRNEIKNILLFRFSQRYWTLPKGKKSSASITARA